MPSAPASRATAYFHALDLPGEAWAVLKQNEPAANIILPFAMKGLGLPRDDRRDQLWIIVYDNTDRNIDFVLSCTKGVLGNYPIFIYSSKSPAQLVTEEDRMADSLLQLVLCLLRNVPPRRVFSVFSLEKVAKKFAELFEGEAPQEYGIRARKDPYYDATFTFLTKEMFNKSSAAFSALPESGDFHIALRRADTSHLEGVTILCKEFASTSPPYGLDDERAKLEADALIRDQQVWVHMIKKGDEEWDTASLVATTRESDNVTAITKVVTTKKWRGHGHGCAARLFHRVCQEIIENNKTAVLYVGNSDDLAPARRIYHKVGFPGLESKEQRVENVEGWLEIGFEGTDLGYW